MPTHTRPTTPHLPPTPQPDAQAEGAGPAPKEDHHKVQSHFNGPISRRSPSSPRCGCRACPKGGPPQGAVPLQRPNPPPGPNPQAKAAGRLVSLCRFPAIFRPGPRPPFGSAPCQIRLVSLFRPFQHPPAGPSAPHPGPCLADTTCLPLSTCPTRLNSKLRRASSRHRPAGKNAHGHYSKQLKPPPALPAMPPS